jgi:hypothetical protein
LSSACVILKNLLKKFRLKKSSFRQMHKLLRKTKLKMLNFSRKKKH